MKNNITAIIYACLAAVTAGCTNLDTSTPPGVTIRNPCTPAHKPEDGQEHVRRILEVRPQLQKRNGVYLFHDGPELLLYGFGHHIASDHKPKTMGDAAKIADLNAWSELVRYIYGSKFRGKRERITSYEEKDGKPMVKDSYYQLLLQQWEGDLHNVETVEHRKNGSKFSTILRISVQPNQKKDQP